MKLNMQNDYEWWGLGCVWAKNVNIHGNSVGVFWWNVQLMYVLFQKECVCLSGSSGGREGTESSMHWWNAENDCYCSSCASSSVRLLTWDASNVSNYFGQQGIGWVRDGNDIATYNNQPQFFYSIMPVYFKQMSQEYI